MQYVRLSHVLTYLDSDMSIYIGNADRMSDSTTDQYNNRFNCIYYILLKLLGDQNANLIYSAAPRRGFKMSP